MEYNIKESLIEKSIEAFILGLEIYNKPTIKYRIEGFSFFICNAWELMLKATLLDRNQSIYYKDNPDRTLSLENCISKIYTNENGNLRKNLEVIIELRNTSTHFITEEYEQIYAPLFQACVINFVDQIKKFHKVDITNYISQNFLTLSINIKEIDKNQINAKYSKEMITKLLSQEEKIKKITENSNSDFFIPVFTRFYITKDENKADIKLKINKNSNISANYITEIKDPNNLYPYRTKEIISIINKKLKTKNIMISKTRNGEIIKTIFTSNDFQLFIKFYDIKNNEKYCYNHKNFNVFSYSHYLIEFICKEIISRPETIINELKKGIKNR